MVGRGLDHGLLVEGQIVAVDTVSGLIDTYAGDVKVVVQLAPQTADSEAERLESTLRESATTVYWSETDELTGVFDDRQEAQTAYSELHEVDAGHSIDLVGSGMEDVFLELAGGTLTAGGDLR